jgi:hypothetical protein
VVRTTDDLDRVEHDLYNIYQSIRLMDKSGHWYCDESQCEATFRCAYCPICYNSLDVFDGETPVDGFKRIFKENQHEDAPAATDEVETDTPEGRSEDPSGDQQADAEA